MKNKEKPRLPQQDMRPSPYQLVEKPTGLRDVPRYLKELLGGFFERLFYIFKLVWETDPRILFILMLVRFRRQPRRRPDAISSTFRRATAFSAAQCAITS